MDRTEIALRASKVIHDLTNEPQHDIGWLLVGHLINTFGEEFINMQPDMLAGAICGTLHKYNIKIELEDSYLIRDVMVDDELER